MDDIIVKATVRPDHTLTARVPEALAAGEYDVVVRVPVERSMERVKGHIARISEELRTGKRRGRTKEEIDAEQKALREEWDDAFERRGH